MSDEPAGVQIAAAAANDVDPITDLWVALAAGQRRYGSELLAEANRNHVREWVARGVVTGELLVATPSETGNETGDEIAKQSGTHTTAEQSAAAAPAGESAADADDGDPIGFVAFERDHGDYNRDRNRGIVSNLFVVPERRGEGIGAALLAAAERELHAAGAETVALEALADNHRARQFYAERGYEPHRIELTKSLAQLPAEGADQAAHDEANTSIRDTDTTIEDTDTTTEDTEETG